MNITEKSTGFLMDELITCRFKVEASPTPDNIQRMRLLDAAIRIRLNGREDEIFLPVTKLQLISRECWMAQEVIMSYKGMSFEIYRHNDQRDLKKIVQAALQAQHTNAQRNQLIREIDTILGEADVSVLGKTYA
jgi:hypothetical protein